MDFDLKRTRRDPFVELSSFQFGIEEEYFVCDAATLQPAMITPETLFDRRHPGTGSSLHREMLQAQIEVASRPHTRSQNARDELIELRQMAAEAAADHGLAILASGTHPSADWRQSVHTPKDRYDELMDGLQMVGQRNMLCGMHVHVEVPDPDARIDIMNRMIPYVPLLIGLSTSSPFWHSRRTGLKGYRLTAYDELPRTGLPELFCSMHDYQAYVSALVASGAIPDATHVWWALRPSCKYPTLELRAPDCCTRICDAMAIAALFRCLVRYLCCCPLVNANLDAVDRAIAVENKWQAQRHGVHATFAASAGPISVTEVLEVTLDKIAADAEALGCLEDVNHCREIVREGSSADAQLSIFTQQNATTAAGSLDDVLRWIAATTIQAHASPAGGDLYSRRLTSCRTAHSTAVPIAMPASTSLM
jgi:glutamate---cysteine ligase / carboxylate-amine ligase